MIYKQFQKFVVIGVFCTIINYCLFYVLYKFLNINYIIASSIGFMAGVFAGYNLNRIWTFGVQEKSHTYVVKYCSVYTTSLLAGLGLLEVLVSVAGLMPELANVIVIAFTTCTNFCGTKFWVFKV